MKTPDTSPRTQNNPFLNSLWTFTMAMTLMMLAPLSLFAAEAKKSLLPDKVIPNGWGVQMKGHSNSAEHLDRVKELGLTWIRHGFHWEAIEKEKGVYDFSRYDRIVEDCHARGIKMVGCIAFSNQKIYGTHAKDEPGRTGYANFAAALAARYKNRDIVWEIWNEPNTMTFWGKHGKKGNSEPYAEEYLGLVKAAVPAIRKANPDAIILGGSVSNMWTESYNWMNFIFQKGILKTDIDAWSVHPYGLKVPEDYVQAYAITRKMMAEAGGPSDIPMLNTERGFPISKKAEGHAGGDASMAYEHQAWYIVRQYLIDLYLDVNQTIWYEWINEKEGFSLWRDGEPLPAYTATKVLIEQLRGYSLDKRIDLGAEHDFVLQFKHPSGALKLVAWTSPQGTGKERKTVDHDATIPVEVSGSLKAGDLYGKPGAVEVKDGFITLHLTDAPQYITLK